MKFNLSPNTNYKLRVFLEDGQEESLYSESEIETKDSLVIVPLSSDIPYTAHLLVKNPQRHKATKLKLYFKLKESSDEAKELNSLFEGYSPSPSATGQANGGIRTRPIEWTGRADIFLSNQWYYKVFDIPKDQEEFNIYLNLGLEDTPIYLVATTFDPKIVGAGSDLTLSDISTGIISSRTGSINNDKKTFLHTFSFEGNLQGGG